MFDKHALKKKRDIRSNLKPFINNEISKAITTRDSLKNCFLQKKAKKIENYFANKKVRMFHFCENLKRIISKT